MGTKDILDIKSSFVSHFPYFMIKFSLHFLFFSSDNSIELKADHQNLSE